MFKVTTTVCVCWVITQHFLPPLRRLRVAKNIRLRAVIRGDTDAGWEFGGSEQATEVDFKNESNTDSIMLMILDCRLCNFAQKDDNIYLLIRTAPGSLFV